ncbi:hypothetical protein BO70DRAFT_90311 [Aspergillus heteromorphus CBS 117.55]|uniref:Uncharacterized protein n=1 Tax=Aspergillus heteromorphus CBS 117.55 TaxID=1448321 RepID=A0A317VTA5_9EURO|nr:uncharacterized protein BO70DRAFT_90311 [Aspergillus heteromorphus CBS 117.55]PWY76172.1 hypothetical protein BO70DRAFT_90311 [Aspergillus heteromorphus CBS 117.55]
MGGFLSIQSKEKRRRSNRLSKPPPNKATIPSASSHTPHQASGSNSFACSPAGAWQNPWTGTAIPVSSPEPEVAGRRSQSLPSVSYQPGAPWPVVNRARKCQSMVRESDDSSLYSPTTSTATSTPLSRRASLQPSEQDTFQPAALWNRPQPPAVHQPKRSYSVHSPAHRSQTAVHHSTIEEATSSNTLFMVDSQGFSLIRRRSLLTRPGVATRRSTRDAARRLSSPPIGQEIRTPNYPNEQCASPQLLLPGGKDTGPGSSAPLTQMRPPTPSDFEYTHLGALKLGSLRVVNGSASPCPSDRTRLNPSSTPTRETKEASTEHLGLRHHNEEDQPYTQQLTANEPSEIYEPQYSYKSTLGSSQSVEGTADSLRDELKISDDSTSTNQAYLTGMHRIRPPTSMLKIPTAFGSEKQREYPASPFSFDISPTITTPYRLRTDETDDEGISVPAAERTVVPLLECDSRHHNHERLQHSHRKVDSGYSSAASDRSLQDAHARKSTDSRRFTLSGSLGNPEIQPASNYPGLYNQLPIRRHLSLQGPGEGSNANFCGWPINTSSMCHEAQQIPVKGRVRSASFTAAPESSYVMSFSQYCHRLRRLESALPELSVVSVQGFPEGDPRCSKRTTYSSPEDSHAGKYPTGTESEPEIQGRGSAGKTACLSRSKFDALRMSIAEGVVNVDPGSIASPRLEPPRGRARSRSIEYQQKSLAKYAKRSNLYMAASPFVFH